MTWQLINITLSFPLLDLYDINWFESWPCETWPGVLDVHEPTCFDLAATSKDAAPIKSHHRHYCSAAANY